MTAYPVLISNEPDECNSAAPDNETKGGRFVDEGNVVDAVDGDVVLTLFRSVLIAACKCATILVNLSLSFNAA